MKKIVFIIAGFCLILLISNIFIPVEFTVLRTITIRANPVSISRFIADPEKLASLSNYIVSYSDSYSNVYCNEQVPIKMIGSAFLPGILKIMSPCQTMSPQLTLVSAGNNSCYAAWTINFGTGKNFFTRVAGLIGYLHYEQKVGKLLTCLKDYLEQEKNIYGISIHQEKVKDSVLVVIQKTIKSPPALFDVYNLIGRLKKYVLIKGAKEMNSPMLHVQESGKSQWSLMVAIPTNVPLGDSGLIRFKRMIPGNILTAEVTGGPAAIRKGIKEIENYLQDRQMSSPALPFESLVINRLIEPDSSRWLTKLYYPVF